MSRFPLEIKKQNREIIISEHKFYVDQAHIRLLFQFNNVDSEIEQAIKEHHKKMAVYFNPESIDPSDFYETAIDHGIAFGQLLHTMHEDTRLGVIAGMYQQWEKS